MYKFFLLYLLFKISLSEIIKIPFGIINTEKNSESFSLISKLAYNKLYINLTIGTPPKKIKIFLRKDNYALFISDINFNKSLSESIESQNKLETFILDILTTGYYSKDILKFGNYNNNDNKKLDFILSVSDDNSLGALGLKIPHNFPEGLSSFIYNLKNNNIISSYTWTLKYYYPDKTLFESINDVTNPIGELIIGGEPHEYEENKNKYHKNDYYFLEAPVHSGIYYWDLKMKSIYTFTDEKIDIINDNYRTDEVSLKAEYSVIWGTKVYYDIIQKHFFKKYEYIQNNICIERNIPEKTHLNYIECIKDNKLFDIKKFPTIYFESIEFKKIFELTYEDLFILDKETNYYIFLIVFPTNYVETVWNLGIPFLRKYQFTYNEDQKVIGFYNSDESNIDIDQNIHNEKTEDKIILYIIIGILFLIFCVLLIFLGMFIHKKVYGEKRRKKANELDDGYEYETNGSINSDKKTNEDNKKESLINDE